MAVSIGRDGPTGNRVLDALPERVLRQLLSEAIPVTLGLKTVLVEPGEPIDAIHFPITGIVSLVSTLEGGAIVEVATVGNEGVIGIPYIPGGALSVRAICQVPGRALRMRSESFFTAFDRRGAFRTILDSYLQALFSQISQAAGCNRLHSSEERLARWLLMTQDRVGADTFPITHEVLGQMLGSRRATVTLAAGLLQAAGLIRYQRGRVTIVDRTGLESVSCECYGVIRAALDRVTAIAAHGDPGAGGPAGQT